MPHRAPPRLASALSAALLSLALTACTGSESTAPPPDDADAVVTGTAGLLFEPDEVALPAGPATFALVCDQGPAHDVVVDVDGEERSLAACNGGQTDVAEVDLPAGDYTFWCSVPGHRQAGMEGTLSVG